MNKIEHTCRNNRRTGAAQNNELEQRARYLHTQRGYTHIPQRAHWIYISSLRLAGHQKECMNVIQILHGERENMAQYFLEVLITSLTG